MIKPLNDQEPLIVTGADGRIGRALRRIWTGRPVLWSARAAGQGIDIAWDIGRDPVPHLPRGAVFLHLAGQTTGGAAELAENRRSALALAQAARDHAAAHVLFMSSSAVYRPGPTLIDETQPPDPPGAYGLAKLEAEEALRATVTNLTILRLGNLAGADALLSAARRGPVVLDPIEGQAGGPERSYIGPQALAGVLWQLARGSKPLPKVLNIAQEPAVPMAALLQAFGADWSFGPPRAEALPRVALSVAALQRIVSVPKATAASLVADLNSLKGFWP